MSVLSDLIGFDFLKNLNLCLNLIALYKLFYFSKAFGGLRNTFNFYPTLKSNLNLIYLEKKFFSDVNDSSRLFFK